MGVKNTGMRIRVLAIFMTRTKSSKNGPKLPVNIYEPQSGATIITRTKLSVTRRALLARGPNAFCTVTNAFCASDERFSDGDEHVENAFKRQPPPHSYICSYQRLQTELFSRFLLTGTHLRKRAVAITLS